MSSAVLATLPCAQNCARHAVSALSFGRWRRLMARWAVSTGCKYNQVNSHFHCIREGCQFSFLLKHQMTSHARKHMRRMLGKNFDRVPPSQVRARPRRATHSQHRVARRHHPCPTLASRWWTVLPEVTYSAPCGQHGPQPSFLRAPHFLSGPPEPDGHGDRRVHGLHRLQPGSCVLRVVHHGPELL